MSLPMSLPRSLPIKMRVMMSGVAAAMLVSALACKKQEPTRSEPTRPAAQDDTKARTAEPARAGKIKIAEIGRASCRERV